MIHQEEIQTVELFDAENQKHVTAEFRNFISDDNVKDWQSRWLPEQYRLLLNLIEGGVDYERHFDSFKWNWRRKVSVLRLNPNQRGFSLVSSAETQAMMIVDISKKCKHPDQLDENLVYIDFVQVAPWNNRSLNNRIVRFQGAGSLMFQKAIEYSMKMLWNGRIGLHSLKGTEGFYRKTKMSDLGLDFEYEGLTYFEMTQRQAQNFVKKEF